MFNGQKSEAMKNETKIKLKKNEKNEENQLYFNEWEILMKKYRTIFARSHKHFWCLRCFGAESST